MKLEELSQEDLDNLIHTLWEAEEHISRLEAKIEALEYRLDEEGYL